MGTLHTEIDEDYIDVEQRRANLGLSDDAEDDLAEYAAAEDASKMDWSHIYGRYPGTLAASDADEFIDRTAPQENDGRSQTRTGFDPRDSGDRQKWRRLNLINDGWRSRERKQQNWAADNRRWVDTFCDRLEMTEYQHERVMYIMQGMDLSRMGRFSSQQVIIAIITLVANEDLRLVRDEDTYHELVDQTGLTMDEVRTLRKMVRRESDRLREAKVDGS